MKLREEIKNDLLPALLLALAAFLLAFSIFLFTNSEDGFKLVKDLF